MRVVRQKLPRTILSGMVLTLLMSVTLAGAVFNQSAHALSLKDTLQQVTQPVKTLVDPLTSPLTRQQSSQLQPTPPSSSSSSTPTSAAPTQASNNQTNTGTSPSAPTANGVSEVAPLETAPLEQVKPINRTAPFGTNNRTNLANVFLKNSGSNTAVADFGMLKATENGWQLFGLLWYWWMGIIAAFGVASWAGLNWFRGQGQM